jgi:hypothetical protein
VLRTSREPTWRRDRAALRRCFDFRERSGVREVVRVTVRHVELFKSWRLTTGVSAATVKESLVMGRAVWNGAIRSGLGARRARSPAFRGTTR